MHVSDGKILFGLRERLLASDATLFSGGSFSHASLRHGEEVEEDEGFCRTTPFGEWSECSEKCGKGFRMKSRNYLMPEKAGMMGCSKEMVVKEMCVGKHPSCP